MALLVNSTGGRRLGLRGANGALAALLLLSIAGCVVLEALGLVEKPLAFPHQTHLEQGLSCADCHNGYEADDEALPIAAAACAMCHADIDAEKAPERQVASLFDAEGNFKGAHVTKLPEGTIFAHSTHVAMGSTCESCHVGIEQSLQVDRSLAVSMDTCLQCHEGLGVSRECKTCHAQAGPDWKPANHELQWDKMHGHAVRAELEGPANDCALCHTEQTCTACHRDEAPQNHTNFWRVKAHGVAAVMDRENCATCHESSFCESCHESTEPISHNGAWGNPMDTHCISCHVPLQGENCYVCHKSASSHSDAPQQPANHIPGMDCRSCHGVNAPLPHVDNGDACNVCHK